LIALVASSAPPPPPRHTLPLHDALPICLRPGMVAAAELKSALPASFLDRDLTILALRKRQRRPKELPAMPLSLSLKNVLAAAMIDRKSTRLNSSHVKISYAVFCLKKKNT